MPVDSDIQQDITAYLEQASTSTAWSAQLCRHALNEHLPDVISWVDKPSIVVELAPIESVKGVAIGGLKMPMHSRVWVVVPEDDGTYYTAALEADPQKTQDNAARAIISDIVMRQHTSDWGHTVFNPVSSIDRPLSDSSCVTVAECSNGDKAAQLFYRIAVAAGAYNSLIHKPYAPIPQNTDRHNCHAALLSVLDSVSRVTQNVSLSTTRQALETVGSAYVPGLDKTTPADIQTLTQHLAHNVGNDATAGITLETLDTHLQSLHENENLFPLIETSFGEINEKRIHNPAMIPKSAWTGVLEAAVVSEASSEILLTITEQAMDAGKKASTGRWEELKMQSQNFFNTLSGGHDKY